ncbi:cupredoxin domain-containing protein [Schlesneria paludicola]|uniref:hypothetical protein n=1 Tax=Schlesneria paludicola TaxID=360056 RepID=UPI00029A2AFE|nr:hypothetical protein [Schlesneria paludicola]
MTKLFSRALAAAIVAAAVTFAPSADAQWGNLKGQILLDGDIPKIAPLVAQGDVAAKDSAVCAAQIVPDEKLVVDPETKGIANIVVYLAKKPAKVHPDLAASKDKEILFDQKGCRFLPHVMIVRTDQSVRVKSDDAVAHNTHTNPIKNTPANFIVTPNDRVGVAIKPMNLVERTPTKISCDIHPWMVAYWMIIDHPYAAVTDEKGNFEIPNLPVGQHEFMVWQESSGWLDKKYAVTIKAGDNQEKPLKYKAAQILK